MPDLKNTSQEIRYGKTIHESHYTLQKLQTQQSRTILAVMTTLLYRPEPSEYCGTNYSLIDDVSQFCSDTSDDCLSYHICVNTVKTPRQIFLLNLSFVQIRVTFFIFYTLPPTHSVVSL